VTTSDGGEAAPGRGKGGDGVSWDHMNLIGLINEENSHIDSVATNEQWRFKTTMNLFILKKHMQVRSSFIYLIA
jgi:hypothetical protein